MTVRETVTTKKDSAHDFLDSGVLSESLDELGITPDWFLRQLLDLYDVAKAEADFKGAAAVLRQIQQFITGTTRLAVVTRAVAGPADDAAAVPGQLGELDPAARLIALTRHRPALSESIRTRAIKHEITEGPSRPPAIDVSVDPGTAPDPSPPVAPGS